MSLTIYGTPASRSFRALWAAEETGLPYRNLPWSHLGPEIREASYLAINPNGTIPALTDDGFALFRAPRFGLDAYPRVKAWHARCLARPAARTAIAMREAKKPA
jgi:glutathione S-transferase